MNRNTVRQVVNVIAFLAVVVVNTLANILPLNGLNTGEISDRFQVFFVPAGYVFAIWGVIYLALGAFTIYQALPGQRENARLQRIGYLFAASSVANIAWLFLWHYEYFLWTLVAMITLLIILIALYLRLKIGREPVKRVERWLVDIPFSIYLGWISVATAANITQMLWYVGWDGFGIAPEMWAVLILLVVAVLSTAMAISRGDVAYLLVIIWASIGIAVKQQPTPVVSITAWAVAAYAAILVILALIVQRRSGASAQA
ncbi:MAG: tryptophan-rich sensory protein [Anaerolineales bacterium]